MGTDPPFSPPADSSLFSIDPRQTIAAAIATAPTYPTPQGTPVIVSTGTPCPTMESPDSQSLFQMDDALPAFAQPLPVLPVQNVPVQTADATGTAPNLCNIQNGYDSNDFAVFLQGDHNRRLSRILGDLRSTAVASLDTYGSNTAPATTPSACPPMSQQRRPPGMFSVSNFNGCNINPLSHSWSTPAPAPNIDEINRRLNAMAKEMLEISAMLQRPQGQGSGMMHF